MRIKACGSLEIFFCFLIISTQIFTSKNAKHMQSYKKNDALNLCPSTFSKYLYLANMPISVPLLYELV